MKKRAHYTGLGIPTTLGLLKAVNYTIVSVAGEDRVVMQYA